MELNVTGLGVLIDGGAALSPHQVALVHRLLEEGARVTIAADRVPTALRDLSERGLISWCSPASSGSELVAGEFDVVLRGQRHDPAPESVQPAREQHADQFGTVVLLGGGPGDPGLLTVAGLAALRQADVVVYDRLAPLSCLDEAPADAILIDVGKIPRGEFTDQERINRVLIEHAQLGRTVVRFKGGDSFVFGRGGEEAQACAAAGIPVRVIPGVSASIAAPELAGIPVTHRQITQGFTVLSGHVAPDDPRCGLDWAAVARAGTTVVILMGVAQLPAIARALIDGGLDRRTPAATISNAGLPSMTTVRAALEDLPVAVVEAKVGAPAVTVIGGVVGLELDLA